MPGAAEMSAPGARQVTPLEESKNMRFPRSAVLLALAVLLPASGCFSFNHFTLFPFGKKATFF